MKVQEMPTESREHTRQSLDTNHGENGATAVTDRTYSLRPLRSEDPKEHTYPDINTPDSEEVVHPGSNDTRRSRRKTSTQTMSAETSPTRSSSHRAPGPRQVKDVVSIHEELSKQTTARPEGDGNGHRQTSRSKAVPAGGPPTSKGSGYRKQESFENPSTNSPGWVQSEITELPPSPRKDEPAVKQTQVQKLMERRAASKEMGYQRRSTADRPVETDKYEDLRSVKRNSMSSSFDRRSTDDRKSSTPASNRRTGRSSSSLGIRRTEQSETRSSSTASNQAERRRFLGGFLGGNNGGNPSVKQESPNRSIPSSSAGQSSKPSSSDEFFDYDFVPDSNNPAISSPNRWPEEEPVAKHEIANGFQNEIKEVDADHLYRRKPSSATGKSRQEDASDLATGSRRTSLGNRSNSKQGNGSHLPVTRYEINGNVTQESDHAHSPRRHGRPSSTDCNSRLDNAASSRASSWGGTTDGRSKSKTLDVVKYGPVGNASVKRTRNTKWLLKGVAAASYNGGWLPKDQMVPYPDDIANLNKFLHDCRNEVNAGAPGKYLTVVLGNENSDLDSLVSTITYAYFLSSTEGQEHKVFAPVLNMRQDELVLHTEAAWLFKVTGLDTSKLLFVDQTKLRYFHSFGNLKLVLVDHSRLAPHQETFQDSVIEIIDHKLMQFNLYPWVRKKDIQQVGSCCTIIAEKFAEDAPKRLTGRGLNRLLLGPILLDTANLDRQSARCTRRDVCTAALLINGAGRYGQHGFYRLLRKMRFDISTLSTIEILRKEFQRWTLGPGKTDTYGLNGRVISAAISTLGVPLREIMTRRDVLQDMKFFRTKLRLDLHLIVTGYFDATDRYQREILLAVRSLELKDHLKACFRPHKSDLQLSYLLVPGLPDDMLVYKQGLVTASRTILRQILTDYFEM